MKPERKDCVEYVNFICIGDRHYHGFNGRGSSVNFKDRDGADIYFCVPGGALARKIGRADYGPESQRVPPDGIVSAYHQGADVHAIAGVGEENFVAVRNSEPERGHAVFWRVEHERGKTFAADFEKIVALNEESRRAAAARKLAEQQRLEFIRAHPWPHRVMVGGEFYQNDGRRDLPLAALDGRLGEVRRAVGTDGAYPADFQWREGDAAWCMTGAPIRAIKGIDRRYYIAVVSFFDMPGHESGEIFASEKRHSDKLEAALEKILDRVGE